MTAPGPVPGTTNPFTLGYQTRQFPNTKDGNPDVTVVDSLATVPSCTINGHTSSGTVAEAAVKALAVEAGTIDVGNKGKAAGAKVAGLVKANRDFVRDFYDTASILRNASGAPIL